MERREGGGFIFPAEQETASFMWEPNSIKSLKSEVAHKGHAAADTIQTETLKNHQTR